MIRNFLSLLMVSALLFSCSQPKSATDYQQLFKTSMEVKDYHSAAFALQCLLQADSSNAMYQDTLAEIYAAVNNYAACEHYTDLALKRHPNDEKFLQMKALCLQEAGKGMELLDFYNKLYASTGKITYLYQAATIQLAAGDMKGAKGAVATIEEKIKGVTDSVDFMISETEKQKVPLRAAVYNVKAYMAAQENNFAGAKQNFELALKEFPNFVTAQQNYMRLMQGAQQRR